MKLIPEKLQNYSRCYFCGATYTEQNPVEYELEVDETRISIEEAKFLKGHIYCCRNCLEKEWVAT